MDLSSMSRDPASSAAAASASTTARTGLTGSIGSSLHDAISHSGIAPSGAFGSSSSSNSGHADVAPSSGGAPLSALHDLSEDIARSTDAVARKVGLKEKTTGTCIATRALRFAFSSTCQHGCGGEPAVVGMGVQARN
ncbi:hypothetical protein EON62_02055 [archaeon]|nr:MAG: hypothetical protein EON62_02055 [archaeon]